MFVAWVSQANPSCRAIRGCLVVVLEEQLTFEQEKSWNFVFLFFGLVGRFLSWLQPSSLCDEHQMRGHLLNCSSMEQSSPTTSSSRMGLCWDDQTSKHRLFLTTYRGQKGSLILRSPFSSGSKIPGTQQRNLLVSISKRKKHIPKNCPLPRLYFLSQTKNQSLKTWQLFYLSSRGLDDASARRPVHIDESGFFLCFDVVFPRFMDLWWFIVVL